MPLKAKSECFVWKSYLNEYVFARKLFVWISLRSNISVQFNTQMIVEDYFHQTENDNLYPLLLASQELSQFLAASWLVLVSFSDSTTKHKRLLRHVKKNRAPEENQHPQHCLEFTWWVQSTKPEEPAFWGCQAGQHIVHNIFKNE